MRDRVGQLVARVKRVVRNSFGSVSLERATDISARWRQHAPPFGRSGRWLFSRWLTLGLAWLFGAAGLLRADEARERLAELDGAIMLRTAPDGKTYGHDEIDPLVWKGSSYLLTGESRTRLRAALEKVLTLPEAEIRRCPPEQRALVQNRVWTLFDSVKLRQPDSGDLPLLAKAIAKLALDPTEIKTLADPLREAAGSGRWPAEPNDKGGPDIFLPRGITDEAGLWVDLLRQDGELTAKRHASEFGGRTWFSVRAYFPDGRAAMEKYFQQVAAESKPWTEDGRLNRSLPVLPKGAMFALVRKLAVIDREGHWQATSVTLSVQIRRYQVTDRSEFERLIATSGQPDLSRRSMQNFAEFRLMTAAAAAGQGASLRAVLPDGSSFLFFSTFDIDQIDGTIGGSSPRVLPGFKSGPQDLSVRACFTCHLQPGLESINTLTFNERSAPLTLLVPATLEREIAATARWKTQQTDWQALRAFWPKEEEGRKN